MSGCLVLVEIAAYRLVAKTLERHGPFWSQSSVFKADLGLSPRKALALRPMTRLSILATNLTAKLTDKMETLIYRYLVMNGRGPARSGSVTAMFQPEYQL